MDITTKYYRAAAKVQLALGSAGLLSSLFLAANGNTKALAILPSIVMTAVGLYCLTRKPSSQDAPVDEP
jgi:hypothetical protein